jgi:hypothetical protein
MPNAPDQEKLVLVDKAKLRTLRHTLREVIEDFRAGNQANMAVILGAVTSVLDQLLAELSDDT